jgi:hypothetical protein
MRLPLMKIPEALRHGAPPPILGSWRNVNIVVLAWLAVLIAIFYAFTRYFS